MRLEVLFHPSKGFPVEFTDAKFFNRPPMFFRSIPFMFSKIVLGVPLMPFQHHPISGYLGYNGGCSNGVAKLVAFSDGFLRHRKAETLKSGGMGRFPTAKVIAFSVAWKILRRSISSCPIAPIPTPSAFERIDS